MMNKLNPDSSKPKTDYLPFASGDLDRSGLRLTRAEFARFLDVSRQAVGEWVAAGKITIGIDGRLDPRQAVSQLLRNTDPARLRSKVLAPLVKELGAVTKRITELETALAQANENSEFHEDSVKELMAQQDALIENLANERDELAKLSATKVIDGLIVWMNEASFSGTSNLELTIADCIPSAGAPVVEKGERE